MQAGADRISMSLIKRIYVAAIPDSIYGKALSFFLTLLLLFLPFQKPLKKIFHSLATAMVPAGLTLPSYFSKELHFYLTDGLILCATFFVLFRFSVSLRRFFWEGPSKFLLCFIFCAFLSVVLSFTSHYPLQYLRVLKIALSVLLFNLFAKSFYPEQSKRWIGAFATLLVILSLIECPIGICQYFHQGVIGIKAFGEHSLKQQAVANPEQTRWIFDSLLHVKTEEPRLYRAAGTLGHANIFGGFLFAAILSSCYLYFCTVRKKIRLCLLAVLLLQFFTLCLTFSRSALLALGVSGVLLLILCGKLCWRKIEQRRSFFRFLLFVILTGAVCVGILFSQIWTRGGIFNYNATTHLADQERILYLKTGWNMWLANPFFGVGFNNFQLCVNSYAPPEGQNILFHKVHNIYLLIGAEMGLVGLSCFLLFIISLIKRCYQGSWSLEKIFLFTLFIGFLLIGGVDMYLFHTMAARLLFFSVAGLLYLSSEVPCKKQ